MKFIKDLIEKNFGLEQGMDSTTHNYRQFTPVLIKENLWFSIQASYAHYCRPRITLHNLTDYTHWEIAFFNSDDFVRVTSVLPEFSSLAEIELYEDGGVYSYVPADLVEELYLALK